MPVSVLFFGATAAAVGKRNIKLDVPANLRVGELLDKILSEHPLLGAHRLRYSINEEYATGEDIVRDGDEVGFFTAVSGG